MARGAHSLGPLSLVALPVMLSLGVLEWQLHSFRARAADAMHASATLDSFERRASHNLLRSTACYLAALLAGLAHPVTLPELEQRLALEGVPGGLVPPRARPAWRPTS